MQTAITTYLVVICIVSSVIGAKWNSDTFVNIMLKCLNVIMACVSGFFLLKNRPLTVVYLGHATLYSLFLAVVWSDNNDLNKAVKAIFFGIFVASIGFLYLQF